MHAAVIPFLVTLAGSAQQPVDAGRATTLRFTDVTAESGLAATMTSGGLPSGQILEVKGGGLALLDVDRDGDLDVFMPNGASLASPFRGPGARLFRNDSTRDALRFTDITAASGIEHVRWSFGATVGDVDAAVLLADAGVGEAESGRGIPADDESPGRQGDVDSQRISAEHLEACPHDRAPDAALATSP